MYKKIFIGSGYLKLRKSKSILGTTTEVILESLNGKTIHKSFISKNTVQEIIEGFKEVM